MQQILLSQSVQCLLVLLHSHNIGKCTITECTLCIILYHTVYTVYHTAYTVYHTVYTVYSSVGDLIIRECAVSVAASQQPPQRAPTSLD